MKYSQGEIIGAALFDFVGELTSREVPITFSARHVATPAADAVADFLEKRGISLEQAFPINDWAACLATPPARVLTPEMLEAVNGMSSLLSWLEREHIIHIEANGLVCIHEASAKLRAVFGIEEGE